MNFSLLDHLRDIDHNLKCCTCNLCVVLQIASRGLFLQLLIALGLLICGLVFDANYLILYKFVEDYSGTALLVLPLWLTTLITCANICIKLEENRDLATKSYPLGYPLRNRLSWDFWTMVIALVVILISSNWIRKIDCPLHTTISFMFVFSVCIIIFKIFEPVAIFIKYQRYYSDGSYRHSLDKGNRIQQCSLWKRLKDVYHKIRTCGLKPIIKVRKWIRKIPWFTPTCLCFIGVCIYGGWTLNEKDPETVTFHEIFPSAGIEASVHHCKATNEDEVLTYCLNGFSLNYQPIGNRVPQAADIASAYCDLNKSISFYPDGVLCTFNDIGVQTADQHQKIKDLRDEKWKKLWQEVSEKPKTLYVSSKMLVIPLQDDKAGSAESLDSQQGSDLEITLHSLSGVRYHTTLLKDQTRDQLYQDTLIRLMCAKAKHDKRNDLLTLPLSGKTLLFLLSSEAVQQDAALRKSKLLSKLSKDAGLDLDLSSQPLIVRLSFVQPQKDTRNE